MKRKKTDTLAFTKMHGLGNDYIFCDGRNLNLNWSSIAASISNRHFGVGSDGIIIAFESDTADLRMLMLNADGSEGLMCGNGIRCLIAFAIDVGMISEDTTPVAVETASGVINVTPIWHDGCVVSARVNMGEPKFTAVEVPFDLAGHTYLRDYPLSIEAATFFITAVSMGNPHAVAVVDEPVEHFDLGHFGPLIEQNTLFPEGVNFEIVNVISENVLKVRVWERGSGLTMACGTGACAAAVVTRNKGLSGDVVKTTLPGGDLRIEWSGRGPVFMEGPVQKVFEGTWAIRA